MDDPITVTDPTDPKPAKRGSRRWPLGTLTLVVIIFVVGGILIFGGDDTPSVPTIPTLGTFPNLTGDPAPDFSIELLDGTLFSLSAHLAADGRPVVLNLWASWCGPCRDEMPALDAAAADHTDVFFLGVAVEDDPLAAEAFAEEIGVSYALAIDETDRVGQRYLSPGLPATFFISSDGQIVKTVFGEVDQQEVDEFIAEAFGL
jgi:thiol-disulfide isomerase/thioredoxin